MIRPAAGRKPCSRENQEAEKNPGNIWSSADIDAPSRTLPPFRGSGAGRLFVTRAEPFRRPLVFSVEGRIAARAQWTRARRVVSTSSASSYLALTPRGVGAYFPLSPMKRKTRTRPPPIASLDGRHAPMLAAAAPIRRAQGQASAARCRWLGRESRATAVHDHRWYRAPEDAPSKAP
jgi:hypothetical protein